MFLTSLMIVAERKTTSYKEISTVFVTKAATEVTSSTAGGLTTVENTSQETNPTAENRPTTLENRMGTTELDHATTPTEIETTKISYMTTTNENPMTSTSVDGAFSMMSTSVSTSKSSKKTITTIRTTQPYTSAPLYNEMTTKMDDNTSNSPKTILLSVFIPLSILFLIVLSILAIKLYITRKKLSNERGEVFALQCADYDLEESML